MCITNRTITQLLQSPPFGKCYSQLGAKIFNSPTFIRFLKPLFKERKRGSFVSWNTLHAKRNTRCCNTWPFSIIVAGMKCYIQSWLSGVFSGSLPLMNKAHLYIFAVGLALFLFRKCSLGLAAICLHSNKTDVRGKKGTNHKISQFAIEQPTPCLPTKMTEIL